MIFTSSETIFFGVTICLITEDGSPERRKMNANLVCSSCFYLTLEQAILFFNTLLYRSIVCYSTESTLIDPYFCFVLCIFDAEELLIDCPVLFFWDSEYNAMIFFFDPRVLEFKKEFFEGFFFFCYDDAATRITINAMYQ